MATVQAEEGDAVGYAFFSNPQQPGEMLLAETYASNEAFLAHNESPHMLRFRARFTELFDPASTRVEFLDLVSGFARGWSAAGTTAPNTVTGVAK